MSSAAENGNQSGQPGGRVPNHACGESPKSSGE
jgi:hypothetical protein